MISKGRGVGVYEKEKEEEGEEEEREGKEMKGGEGLPCCSGRLRGVAREIVWRIQRRKKTKIVC